MLSSAVRSVAGGKFTYNPSLAFLYIGRFWLRGRLQRLPRCGIRKRPPSRKK
jgi:hypothetical protein